MSKSSGRHARVKKKNKAVLIVTLTLIVVLGGFSIYFLVSGDRDGLKGKVNNMIYPKKYSEQVERYADEFKVDKNLIYAVIRTESGFRPEAESHAGALGLMQLMPETFDWLQESLDGEIAYATEELTDPDINVRYGTYFLSMLMADYDGNIRTVAAAYNAGFSNVDDWLKDSAYSPDGKNLTTIPYSETADYADKVEEAYNMYGKLYP